MNAGFYRLGDGDFTKLLLNIKFLKLAQGMQCILCVINKPTKYLRC